MAATGLENISQQEYKSHNILYKTVEAENTEVTEMGDRKRLRVGEPQELPAKRRAGVVVYGSLEPDATSLPRQTSEPTSPLDIPMGDTNNISSSQETLKDADGTLYGHFKFMHLGIMKTVLTLIVVQLSKSASTHSTPTYSSLSNIPPAELRQRAQSMVLRLRLANYKVETNQIDVPISKLVVIAPPKLPTLPGYSGSFTCPKPRTRTPLPTTVPDIKLRRPSSEPNTRIPSSPPSQDQGNDEDETASPRKPFVTPLLPRRRDGLSSMPGNASPTRKDPSGRDLTSSVVKKTAADSLLDLMRQNEYSRSF